MTAAELIADELDEALTALENGIAQGPADPRLRVFLFQILALMGRWDRATTRSKSSLRSNPRVSSWPRPAARPSSASTSAPRSSPENAGDPLGRTRSMGPADHRRRDDINGQGNHDAAADLRASASTRPRRLRRVSLKSRAPTVRRCARTSSGSRTPIRGLGRSLEVMVGGG